MTLNIKEITGKKHEEFGEVVDSVLGQYCSLMGHSLINCKKIMRVYDIDHINFLAHICLFIPKLGDVTFVCLVKGEDPMTEEEKEYILNLFNKNNKFYFAQTKDDFLYIFCNQESYFEDALEEGTINYFEAYNEKD